ncbi:hypothetical protein FRB99_005714 [Tulasnella sp. 403]|nr:hypothetical protein FRB99_005714 [Tulasnella sp. 403]
MSSTVMPATLPHMQYSPQQLLQLEALAKAHQVAQQHHLAEQQRPAAVRANSSPTPVTYATQSAPIGQAAPALHIPPNEQRIIEIIAGLASQHHLSDYSRMKFGERGCPTPYIPLSISVPGHLHELRQRQAINVAGQSFFCAQVAAGQAASPITQEAATNDGMLLDPSSTFAGGSNALPPFVPTSFYNPSPEAQSPFPFPRSRSVPTMNPPASPMLQEALSTAISSTLPWPTSLHMANLAPRATMDGIPPGGLGPTGVALPPPKTSASHPINISYLIPPEMVPFISTYLSQTYPQYLPHISPSQPLTNSTVDTTHQVDTNSSHRIPQFTLPGHLRFDAFLANQRPIRHSYPTPQHQIHHAQAPSHPHARRSLEYQPFTLADQLAPPDRSIPTWQTSAAPVPICNVVTYTSQGDLREAISEALQPFPLQSPRLQHEESAVRGRDTEPVMARYASTGSVDTGPVPSLPYPLTAGGAHVPTQNTVGPTPTSIPPSFPFPPQTLPPAPSTLPAAHAYPLPSGPQIGNMLLSSCPGKKVRLTGPVKGRGAICRSLPQDLARIRSLNVGLVINCLDDSELEFLGAPWKEYSELARRLGLDVLRIPTPEGLAPLDPSTVDGYLDWVIRNYTLKGVNVLVHCRGGVGRAGLIASCWTIKMGLCGPVSESLQQLLEQGAQTNVELPPSILWSTLVTHGLLRRESFQLVSRVVSTIRCRRSVKAIETYEQARFLIDFVEHLREYQEAQVVALKHSATNTLGHTGECDQAVESTVDGESTGGSPSPSVGRNSDSNTDDTLVDSTDLPTATCGEDPFALSNDEDIPMAGVFQIHFVKEDDPTTFPSNVPTRDPAYASFGFATSQLAQAT